MDMEALRKLGEWAALGFYEAQDRPWPLAYGVALRRMYENMPVAVPEGKLLIPTEPMHDSKGMLSSGLWCATSMIVGINHHAGLIVNRFVVDAKKAQFPELAGFIEELAADAGAKLKHFGGYTHSNPDIERVVKEGFLAMEAELDRELAAVQAEPSPKPGELNFLLTLKEYAEGVKAFHRATVDALRQAAAAAKGERRRQLETIGENFAHCFLNPAENFIQGFLAVNFTWMLDGCDSIGRLDQALGPLWERDRADGVLDLPLARGLVDELFQTFERFNGWNLQIGGRKPDGSDGCNLFTEELLDACKRNHVRRPNVAFRVTADTPDRVLVKAMDALREGSGRPALYNDDLYIKTLLEMDLGLTVEDARQIGFGGCTETMIAGMSNVGSLDGEVNLAYCLMLALHDGFDPVAKNQAGPHSGEFASFTSYADFEEAAKAQIRYQTDRFVALMNDALRQRFTAGDPKCARSLFTRDCVKNHKSFEAGGARYNWSVVTYQGIATLIDGMAAVKRLIFEDRSMSKTELLAALDGDFAGAENRRQQLLAAPKFGNDDPYVDQIAKDMVGFSWRYLYQYEPPRGGRYLPSCILFTTYAGAGKRVGATPDGRKAFEPLPDSAGPAAGRDLQGVTAMMKSVTKLPLSLAAGTPVVNIKFPRKLMDSQGALENCVALSRAYFAMGGMQLQLTVVDAEELRQAKAHPEEHDNLIIRIGGFSELFNRLGPELQDSVIARTEHGV